MPLLDACCDLSFRRGFLRRFDRVGGFVNLVLGNAAQQLVGGGLLRQDFLEESDRVLLFLSVATKRPSAAMAAGSDAGVIERLRVNGFG